MFRSQLVESIIAMIFGAVIIVVNCLDGFSLPIVVCGGLIFIVGLIYAIMGITENKRNKK